MGFFRIKLTLGLKCIVVIYMKASIVDLRYKMNSVLKALERNEKVTISHRGVLKGTIVPATLDEDGRVEDHPFFGSDANANELSVEEVMDEIRKPRSHDL